jgi:hypothetical protein
VLQNSPLRLVRVSRVASDNAQNAQVHLVTRNPLPDSPLVITLDKNYHECPELTQGRLSNTADDQLLFFWAETAFFTISGPVSRTISQSNSRDVEIQHFEVLDLDENVIGLTYPCDATIKARFGKIKEERVEFIAIANNRPVLHQHQKIALQVERRTGIAYRINMADISEDAWNRSSPKHVLVALG